LEENQLTIEKTVRWFADSSLGDGVTNVWIVLHGYGQLGSRFLSRFSTFSDRKRVWIAPEGMHRFYLEGSSGKVGASWMTREDRESDIQDNIKYLNSLVALLKLGPNAKIHLLGFSQGVATAVRWFCNSELEFASLVLWAGSFPPDVSLSFNSNKLKRPNLFLVWGEKDEIASADSVHELESEMVSHDLLPKLISFDGGHEIEAGALAKLIEMAENG